MTPVYEETSVANVGKESPRRDALADYEVREATPPAGTGIISRRLPFVAVVAVLLATTYHLVVAGLRYSVNILYWDQWDFYTPLFQQASLWQIFTWQQGPHREGIGLVIDKFVLDLTGWDSKAEVLFMIGALFAATLVALYLKHKLFGRFDFADVIIPCFFLTFAQMEVFTGAPNPSCSAIPELLLGLYCLSRVSLSSMDSKLARKYLILLALNFLLIFDGYGVFIGPVTIGVLVLDLRRGWIAKSESLRWTSIAFAVAVISFAAFFYHYRWDPAVPDIHFPDPNLWKYPWFVALAFGYFLGLRSAVPATLVGGTLALATLVILGIHFVRIWRVRGRGWSAIDATVVILSSFSLLFAGNAAVGRVFLGMPEAAQVSRYMGLLIPAFFAIYLHILSWRKSIFRGAVLALLAIAILPGTVLMPNGYSPQIVAEGKRAWKSCILQAGNIDYCNQATGFPIYPDARKTHLLEKLQYLQKNRLNLYSDLR